MPTAKLTKTSVEGVELPARGARHYVWDSLLKGFGIMVMPTGVRSYIVQYRIGGRAAKTKRYTIGKHGNPWTCDLARERAADLLADIQKGIDPVDQEKRRVEAEREGRKDASRLAFDAYVETFGRKYVDVGGKKAKGKGQPLRTGADIKATLRREWIPVFRSKSLTAIRKADIVAALDEISDRSMSAAIKAHKWLRRLLEWAVERGDLAASPMDSIPAPGTDGSRDRVLKGQELRAVWAGAEAMAEPYRSFFQILLLTGQRLREVAGMMWSEVDLDNAIWIIPGARTKNRRDHLVPLASLVVSILSQRNDRTGPVFSTRGAKPINGFSKPKAALDKQVARAAASLYGGRKIKIEPWVNHDLRRSFFTGGQALGFPREHMHAAVNHAADDKKAGLARVYGLYEYQAEKTAVMTAWSRHIEALISGKTDNVVPLASARA